MSSGTGYKELSHTAQTKPLHSWSWTQLNEGLLQTGHCARRGWTWITPGHTQPPSKTSLSIYVSETQKQVQSLEWQETAEPGTWVQGQRPCLFQDCPHRPLPDPGRSSCPPVVDRHPQVSPTYMLLETGFAPGQAQ